MGTRVRNSTEEPPGFRVVSAVEVRDLGLGPTSPQSPTSNPHPPIPIPHYVGNRSWKRIAS